MKKIVVIGHPNIGKTLLIKEKIKFDFTCCSTAFMGENKQAVEDLNKSCIEMKKSTDLVLKSLEDLRTNFKKQTLKNVVSKYHK